ncbi:hypothetical protein GW17_00002546 [Ensete ventricosum]|nr:hypothetical protein GW17_00002546 [Ensete ventricosum]
MNAFRFAGDMSHLVSVLVLLLKIYATKSCSGSPRARTRLLPRISASPLWNLNFWAFRGARDLAQDAGAVRAAGKTTQSFNSRLKLNVKTKCRLQDRKYLRWED